VGVVDAGFGLVMDAVSSVQSFVSVFIWVYTLLILFYVLMSWIQVPYWLSGVHRFLRDVCEPYLRLFRSILPSVGAFDFSPVIGVLVLVFIERLLADVIFPRLR
jgi:YggT family protein